MLRDELAPSCRMTKTNFAGSNTIISSTSSAFVCVEASCAVVVEFYSFLECVYVADPVQNSRASKKKKRCTLTLARARAPIQDLFFFFCYKF